MTSNLDKFTPHTIISVSVVLIGIMMTVLEGTIMNVALPSLAVDFGVSPSNAIWIVNSYQLVITMSLLAFASLGDIHGYRNIFLIGVAIFTLASIGCASANSFAAIVAWRVAQGVGAACTMSVNTALIRLVYPPKLLARGIGVNAMVISLAAAAGPTVAGAILAFASWKWLFLINVPLGLLAFSFGLKLLPQNPDHDKKWKFDGVSAIANAITFGLLILTIDGVSQGENLPKVLIQIAVLLVVGTYYVRRQFHLENPLLPVDLIKIPIFGLSMISSICSFSAQMLALVSLPFFFQNNLGFSVSEVGFLITPWAVATILVGPISGRLCETIHPGLLGSIGMIIFAAGLTLILLLPQHPSVWGIVWRMALCGAGFRLFQTPNNLTIISSSPIHRSGGASGMQGIARLTGQTIGTALVALIYNVLPHASYVHHCLILAIIISVAAALVSGLRTRQPNPANEN